MHFIGESSANRVINLVARGEERQQASNKTLHNNSHLSHNHHHSHEVEVSFSRKIFNRKKNLQTNQLQSQSKNQFQTNLRKQPYDQAHTQLQQQQLQPAQLLQKSKRQLRQQYKQKQNQKLQHHQYLQQTRKLLQKQKMQLLPHQKQTTFPSLSHKYQPLQQQKQQHSDQQNDQPVSNLISHKHPSPSPIVPITHHPSTLHQSLQINPLHYPFFLKQPFNQAQQIPQTPKSALHHRHLEPPVCPSDYISEASISCSDPLFSLLIKIYNMKSDVPKRTKMELICW